MFIHRKYANLLGKVFVHPSRIIGCTPLKIVLPAPMKASHKTKQKKLIHRFALVHTVASEISTNKESCFLIG